MKYMERLIEVAADWFMDFFLDPVYLVESSLARVEVVSMTAVTAEYVVTPVEPGMSVLLESEVKIVKQSQWINAFVIAVLMRIEGITIALINYFSPKHVRENVIKFVIQPFSLSIFSSRYLTG